jgi:polyphosphate kinase 2 (PPK2 family)
VLERIELDRKLGKAEYKRRLPDLQARLLALEQALLETHIPVLIVVEGWAGTAKIGTIGVLLRGLDPRGLRVYSTTPPRTYETQYPWLHRFWLKTPRYGQISIYDRSWYREVLEGRTRRQLDPVTWRARCEDIVSFERLLSDDGAVIMKFWLHISKQEQHRRFRKLLATPVTAWQVTDEDRWQQRHYSRVRDAAEDLLVRTDAPHAPWTVLPATDRRYVEVEMLESVVGRLERAIGKVAPLPAGPQEEEYDAEGVALRRQLDRLRGALPAPANHLAAAPLADPAPAAMTPEGHDVVSPTVAVTAVAQSAPTEGQSLPPAASAPAPSAPEPPPAGAPAATTPGILARVDLSKQIDDATYARKLSRLQAKLHLLAFQVYLQKRPVILVFEGWDAAGKGGTIQRITVEMDPRSYVVHAIAAPTGEDKAHHYLYRFWRRLPTRGQIAIFDRSWYGRVLVERVEGFAREEEWRRAYGEINEFERQLVDFGTIICKFWLQISPDEQMRRFEEREQSAFKSWKLTAEDWRNRQKWPRYEEAADEMLLRTSTPAAPWTVVEAEQKRYARIAVLRTVVRRLEGELGKARLK